MAHLYLVLFKNKRRLIEGNVVDFSPHDIFPGLSIIIQFYIIWTCLLHHWHLYFVFLKKKKKFLEDISPFCGATDTPVWDFWWCLLWFLSQSGQPYLPLAEAYVSHIPWDSPLGATPWQPSHFLPHICKHASVGLKTRIYHAATVSVRDQADSLLSYAGSADICICTCALRVSILSIDLPQKSQCKDQQGSIPVECILPTSAATTSCQYEWGGHVLLWTNLRRSPVMTTSRGWVDMSRGVWVGMSGTYPMMHVMLPTPQPPWTDRHLWKHYLPTTTVATTVASNTNVHTDVLCGQNSLCKAVLCRS